MRQEQSNPIVIDGDEVLNDEVRKPQEEIAEEPLATELISNSNILKTPRPKRETKLQKNLNDYVMY